MSSTVTFSSTSKASWHLMLHLRFDIVCSSLLYLSFVNRTLNWFPTVVLITYNIVVEAMSCWYWGASRVPVSASDLFLHQQRPGSTSTCSLQDHHVLTGATMAHTEGTQAQPYWRSWCCSFLNTLITAWYGCNSCQKCCQTQIICNFK